MTKTLDEWVYSNVDTTLLMENLMANIEVYCPDLPQDEKEALLRLNLIMVRQFTEAGYR